MALITGGNMLIAAMTIIVLMVVVSLGAFVFVFNTDNLLSASLANLLSSRQVTAPEVVVEDTTAENVTEEQIVEKELSIDEARQLLGFTEYPVVSLPADQISIFSPQAIEQITPLSEAEIQQRCSRYSISFNHDRCLRAERNCATTLISNQEHLRCLAKHRERLGLDL